MANNVSAIIQQSFAEAEATCSWPWVFNYEIPLPGTSLNVHHIFMIVVGGLGLINVLIALYLLVGHLRNWTRPQEQKQYARIILFPIWLSICNLLAMINYHHTDQIEPVGQLWEGVAVVAIYMLCIHIVGPASLSVDSMREIELQSEGMKKVWKFVFQIIPVRIITFVAFEVVYGVTCPLSKAHKNARTVINVLVSISTVWAIIAVIMFQRRYKNYHQGHSPLLSLAAFKIAIGLQAIQSVVFTVLATHTHVLQPPAPYYISYNDLARGIPLVLFQLFIFIATISYLWAFAFTNFRGETKQSGPIRALSAVFNPVDVVQSMNHAFFGSRGGSDLEDSDSDYVRNLKQRDRMA